MATMPGNRVTSLFKIKYPILQGGMIWCSGWELAAAVSNAGGLGIIGAGSMTLDSFKTHLKKCRAATDKPFGVNLPLAHNAAIFMPYVIEQKIPVVITSAGSPKLWTEKLKRSGATVVHVVPNSTLALKCTDAGVDAIVAEGFEAGGHNGYDEMTTMALIPQVRAKLPKEIPLIAAGGIATGEAIVAAMALGAEGVQIGTRFVATKESSGAQAFKEAAMQCGEGDTALTMKQLSPTRVLLNKYGKELRKLSDSGATKEQIYDFRGPDRTLNGMFKGDIENGEIVIGQIFSHCRDIPSVEELMQRLVREYNECSARLAGTKM